MTATHDTSRSTGRTTTLVVCTALLVTLGSAPAAADRPVFQDHVQVHHELSEHPQLTAACGFEVMSEVTVNMVLRLFEDGSGEIQFAERETLVAPVSGEVLEHHMAGRQSWQGSQQVDGHLLTIDQQVRYTGLPSMWRKSGEGVLLRDAGVADLDVHLVVDLSQDPPQLVEQDIQVDTVHGPHPELEMSNEEFVDFTCAALS